MLVIGKVTYDRLNSRLGLEINNKKLARLETGKQVFLCPDMPSLGTKLDQGKYLYNNNTGIFFVDKGVDSCRIKPGKLFRKLFRENNPQAIEFMIKKWNQHYINANSIKVSSNIEKIYNKKHATTGTIAESCMKSKGNFYRRLQEIAPVKVLYIEKNGQLIGRALLWEKVYFPKLGDSRPFMDRIYFDKEATLEIFKSYAKKNNFVFKARQSYCDKELFIYQDEQFEDVVSCELSQEYNAFSFDCPCLDTLTVLTPNQKMLVNSDKCFNSYFAFDNTTGDINPINITCCLHCGKLMPEDQAMLVFRGDGNWLICKDCLKKGPYVHCIDSDTYVLVDLTYYCASNNEYYQHADDLINIDGAYYHTDDTNIFWCEHCNEYHLKSEHKALVIFDLYYDRFVCEKAIENDSFILTEDIVNGDKYTFDCIDKSNVYLVDEQDLYLFKSNPNLKYFLKEKVA